VNAQEEELLFLILHGARSMDYEIPVRHFDDLIKELVQKEKLNRLVEDTDWICKRGTLWT
jgi:hypothetical protein